MQMEYTLIKYNSMLFENTPMTSFDTSLDQQNISEENTVSLIGFMYHCLWLCKPIFSFKIPFVGIDEL